MESIVSQTVGQIAATYPSAARVFHRYDIDFCCGGKRTLTEACRARGVDADAVAKELSEQRGPSLIPWEERSLRELVEHIVLVHHRPLPGELDRLEVLARKVLAVHGPSHPEVPLAGVVDAIVALRADLLPHLHKEEEILFPWILAGHEPPPEGPIEVMEADHEAVGALLAQARALTDDYRLPDGACATWTALWRGLEALEVDLHQHIHLENNVLHPRALAR